MKDIKPRNFYKYAVRGKYSPGDIIVNKENMPERGRYELITSTISISYVGISNLHTEWRWDMRACEVHTDLITNVFRSEVKE